MRMTIATRIFLALTAVSLLILTMNAAVTRWNFQRGFLEYVADQEAKTVNGTAAALAGIYRRDGNWESLRDNPRGWTELLRQNSAQPPPGPRPERGQPDSGPRVSDPRREERGRRGGPPPNDPLEFRRRVSLLDADRTLIAGAPRKRDKAHSVPVIVDGATVGYVAIAPRQQLNDEVDRNFAREQERSIYVIAIAALLLAALISAILARQLTRPIRALAAGTRSITAGDYETRIPAVRDDELGDLARDFNQLSETLKKNQISRQQWVADIAHELRTPLAVLRGELDAIEDGIRTFDRGTQRSLQNEIARLTKLVGELHDLSVYDEGGHDEPSERVDLTAMLANVLASARNRLADAVIELDPHLPDSQITVTGDSTRLEQVFMNLVENTIRYTDAPGRLAVRCTARDDMAVVEFSDSSPGVPDRALDRLFDRLYRVDASRSRETGGSGLGLSICKAIIEAHGGTIEADNSDLGGLLIRIRLHVEPPESSDD